MGSAALVITEDNMKIATVEFEGWVALVAMAALMAAVIGLLYLAGENADLKTALTTPLNDMNVGHLAGLIVLAGVMFK